VSRGKNGRREKEEKWKEVEEKARGGGEIE